MLTEEQRQLRKKYIGSSDMSAILGLNPYCSAEDVRLEKAGKLEDWKGNEAAEAGVYLEPAIRQWAQDNIGQPLKFDTMHVHSNGIMCANLDAETEAGEPVECKSSGIVGPIFGNWGTAGTDQVPEMHIVQVTHQLACHPQRPLRGYVAALLGGRGFVLYQIERNDELIAAIEKQAVYFWNEYVLKNRPAPNSLPSLAIARRIKRQAGLVIAVDESVCDQVAEALRLEKEARQRVEQAKANLLRLADGADAIRRGMDGVIQFTFNPDKNGKRSLRFKGDAA